MQSIVIIPARGGSKGLPNKNIKVLDGKPLIYYTINAAREMFSDEQIIVSTDSETIKNCVEEIELKVPFLRPVELATDTASSVDVLLHALNHLENQGIFPESIVLLQPTSPFRTKENINEALKLYHKDIDMVVSVNKAKANPYFNLFEENENGFLAQSKKGNFTRRQDCPDVWEYNGAIYIINVASLKQNKNLNFDKVVKYVMEEKDSLDIDTPMDWALAEYLINKK